MLHDVKHGFRNKLFGKYACHLTMSTPTHMFIDIEDKFMVKRQL